MAFLGFTKGRYNVLIKVNVNILRLAVYSIQCLWLNTASTKSSTLLNAMHNYMYKNRNIQECAKSNPGQLVQKLYSAKYRTQI